jgi:hypothetical protein
MRPPTLRVLSRQSTLPWPAGRGHRYAAKKIVPYGDAVPSPTPAARRCGCSSGRSPTTPNRPRRPRSRRTRRRGSRCRALRDQRQAVPRRCAASVTRRPVDRRRRALAPAWRLAAVRRRSAFDDGGEIWVVIDLGGEISSTAVCWLNARHHVGCWIGHGDSAVLHARDPVEDLADRYTIRGLSFDPWRSNQLSHNSRNAASTCPPSRRPTPGCSPASQRLHQAIVERELTLLADAELARPPTPSQTLPPRLGSSRRTPDGRPTSTASSRSRRPSTAPAPHGPPACSSSARSDAAAPLPHLRTPHVRRALPRAHPAPQPRVDARLTNPAAAHPGARRRVVRTMRPPANPPPPAGFRDGARRHRNPAPLQALRDDCRRAARSRNARNRRRLAPQLGCLEANACTTRGIC